MKEVWQACIRQAKKMRNLFSHPYWDRVRMKEVRRRWDTEKFLNIEGWVRGVIREGWTRPLGNEVAQSKASFAWPLYTNPRFDRELTKFMFSFREETSTNRNINSLMFITGPEHSGKSWFLRHNLEKFCKANVAKVLVHVDLSSAGLLNFERFLDIFEGEIVKVLINKSAEKFKDLEILTGQMVLDLLLYNHDKGYLDIKLNQIIEKSIKNDDLLFLTPEQKKKLTDLQVNVSLVSKSKTGIIDNFHNICEILSETSTYPTPSQRVLSASLNLAMVFYMNEELSECPIANFSGFYRKGIKTTWFLLDLLNLIGGYHEMNTGSEFPHVLVVLGNFYLENTEKLLDIETAEDRPRSWIESIAMKLYVFFI